MAYQKYLKVACVKRSHHHSFFEDRICLQIRKIEIYRFEDKFRNFPSMKFLWKILKAPLLNC